MATAGRTSRRLLISLSGVLFTVFACGEPTKLTAILPPPVDPPLNECTAGEGHGAGPLPPMGWNGWNTFACTAELDQTKFRANADALVTSGLHAVGYEYMNLDDCWQGGRSADGTVLASPTRFPDGLAALGTYLHQKGLKFGVNSSVGSCVRAEVTTPGSGGHEAQDAAAYASFGVDYLKYNACGGVRSAVQANFETMRDALIQTGRPTLMSLVALPFKYWQQQVGQLWRTHGDITPSWQGVLDILDATTKLAAYAGQGGYNDSDMLWIGNPALSENESRAYFSAWAILASPLIAGNDLTTMSDATRAILSRSDVIALDQDALRLQAVLLLPTQQNVMVLAKPLSQCGARGVVLLNRGERAAMGSLTWRDLGLASGTALIRDLWTGSDSTAEDGITVTVPAHDAVALRIVGSELPLPHGEALLSDLSWTYAANGWGPVERDQEVGETAAGDGAPLTLAGQRYAKGLGVNSPSLVRYRLGKRCHGFSATIGIDDVTNGAGSAVFQVWADGEKLFDSGVINGGAPAQRVNVDVSGRSELRLWVGEVEDIGEDHADWADARVHCDD